MGLQQRIAEAGDGSEDLARSVHDGESKLTDLRKQLAEQLHGQAVPTNRTVEYVRDHPIVAVLLRSVDGQQETLRKAKLELVIALKNLAELKAREMALETGFALVGNIFGSGTTRKIVVKGLVDAGPDAECSAGHVDFDRDYQTREVEKLRMIDWEVCHIGDAHLHPGSMDHCSGGDYQTDRANVLASNSQEMVFVIATGAHAHRGGEAKDSLYVDGLKLDFFYMGVDSGFEYRKVMPKIARGEAALKIDDSLKCFYDSDPVRVVLDFDNLRRLTDYSFRFTICSMGDGHSSPCVEMTHKRLEYRLLIFFGDSAFEKPDVYVDIGQEIVQYDSDYVKNTPAAHLCFTQIALAAERDVPILLTQNTMTNGKKPADGKPASSITT